MKRKQFVMMTEATDVEADFYLDENGWDVQRAVKALMGDKDFEEEASLVHKFSEVLPSKGTASAAPRYMPFCDNLQGCGGVDFVNALIGSTMFPCSSAFTSTRLIHSCDVGVLVYTCVACDVHFERMYVRSCRLASQHSSVYLYLLAEFLLETSFISSGKYTQNNGYG